MTSSQTKRAGDGAQQTDTTKDASLDLSSSETKKADESGEDVKTIKNPKNINYYHGLKVEDLEHVDEPQSEPEVIEKAKPKPKSATTTEPTAISKAQKRRERRIRNAFTSSGISDDEEDYRGRDEDAQTSAAVVEMIQQLSQSPVEAVSADQKDSEPTAPGALIESDDDDIFVLELDNEKQHAIIAPEDSTSPSTTTPSANDEAVPTHAIKNDKPALAEVGKPTSTLQDDIALFGDYTCLILACYAQYGLDQISIAQILLLVGTVGVCIPLEWFAKLFGVMEAGEEIEEEGDVQKSEKGEESAVHSEMTDAKLEGVLKRLKTIIETHGIGYGWMAVMTMGFVIKHLDARSEPALATLFFSVGVLSYFSGRAITNR